MVSVFLAGSLSVIDILLPIGLILLFSKLLGIGAKKIGLPQVAAMLLTGIVLGLLYQFVPWINQNVITDTGIEGIRFIAEIGVILIMFSAGLGTDVKQIRATGISALVITVLDVILAIGLGFLVSGLVQGFTGTVTFTNAAGNEVVVEKFWTNLFYGVILSATSVSVTVATLKELGKLNSRIGTTIVSAAILDDIIGVIVLSVVLSLSSTGSGSTGAVSSILSSWGVNSIVGVILSTVLFFVFIFLLGLLIRKIFNHLEKKYPHHRRIPIYGLATCFIIAFLSEKVFGIADITGAYFSGLLLSGRQSSKYIERRSDIASYIMFTPVFFAKIGLTTHWEAIDSTFLVFGIFFLIAALVGKFIGASFGAKVTGNTWKDSLCCGAAMVVRAEVCLVSAQKGIDAGLINPNVQIFLIILIITTSFVVPLILKAAYKKDAEKEIDLLNATAEEKAMATQNKKLDPKALEEQPIVEPTIIQENTEAQN